MCPKKGLPLTLCTNGKVGSREWHRPGPELKSREESSQFGPQTEGLMNIPPDLSILAKFWAELTVVVQGWNFQVVSAAALVRTHQLEVTQVQCWCTCVTSS